MKISADIVGREAGPEQVQVDKRWIMAYNAALGEVSEAPHPLFPVCYEWDATRALREATGLQALNARGEAVIARGQVLVAQGRFVPGGDCIQQPALRCR